MASNMHIRTISIAAANGWVALASVPLVLDVLLRTSASGSNAALLRTTGSTDSVVLLVNQWLELRGVDLSDLEVSTASTSPIDVYVVAQSGR